MPVSKGAGSVQDAIALAPPAKLRRGFDGETVLAVSERWWAHVLFVCGTLLLAALLPDEAWSGLTQHQGGVFLSLGALAIWRYSWGLLHFLRAQIYRRVSFPRLRANADTAFNGMIKAGAVPRTFLLVTSFRQDGDTAAEVYRATFLAARNAEGPVTVVASIVEMADQRLVTRMFELLCGPSSEIKLVIVRIPGTGKRDALGAGFRAIAKTDPGPDDVVAVIDGDSIIPHDLVGRCLGFFADPDVGALTTDETSRVRGRALFHLWYSLRFAQRHVLMASHGLARRVLTLTGRMSMIRAKVICNPDFIQQVENDHIDHWRIGEVKFLTGDDKSSWFWLLRNGYKMVYVDDVVVSTVEDPPGERFIPAAAQLMTRWFGNMLRTNGRALALGPGRIGAFTWLAIFDQRISMWTSLAGLVMVILTGIFISPYAFLLYAVWILASRYILTLLLFTSRKQVSALYPFFIYFNQIFGSLIKTYIFFRPYKQRWTRQKTTLAGGSRGFADAYIGYSSLAMHVIAIAVFVTLVAWIIGLLPTPEWHTLDRLIGLVDPRTTR